MTIDEYLRTHPVTYTTEVERIRTTATRAGIVVSRAELLAALGRAGCRVERPRDRWVAVPANA